VVILALARSRISQFGFLAMSSIVLIVIGWKILGSIERRAGLTLPDGWSPRRIGLILLNTALLAALVAGLVLGAGRAAGRSDPRLWALESIRDRIADSRAFYPNEVTFAVGDRLAFAERLVYWTAAYRTFSLFPILGVGPGNAGLLFEQTVVDYGFGLTEIQQVVREASFGFPNPKNLWARLLAETGVVGFLLFGWWFASLGLRAAALWRRGKGFERYLGLAGVLALLAQLVEGFSLDTYALPQLWLVFGLVTSGWWESQVARAVPDKAVPAPRPRSTRRAATWTRRLSESTS
jgi:O-antigen ligase